MAILVTYSTTILIWFLFISHSSFNHFIIIASANIAVNERCKQSKMIQPIAGMGMHAVWLTHDDVLAWAAGRPAGGRYTYTLLLIIAACIIHYTDYTLLYTATFFQASKTTTPQRQAAISHHHVITYYVV